MSATERIAAIERRTRETAVNVVLSLDPGLTHVSTGIGFLDHLFSTLALHAGFSLSLACTGDLEVDDHHSAEDCALAVGTALRQAMGDAIGLARFGYAYAPLDEALARAVVDLSGRPCAVVELGLQRPAIGALASENVAHVIKSMAT
ncbi:MAG: imidazoleglycerol-phosphate dehydratase, partial [Spirochaetales bacterium]